LLEDKLEWGGIVVAKKRSDQFEDALKRLQEVVDKLEKGDLPLEDAMESFSEGIRLAQFCHKKLEEAENKVQLLLKDQQGGWVSAPFEAMRGNSGGQEQG
jgi:exodeoxyribonuclease VII small subunit